MRSVACNSLLNGTLLHKAVPPLRRHSFRNASPRLTPEAWFAGARAAIYRARKAVPPLQGYDSVVVCRAATQRLGSPTLRVAFGDYSTRAAAIRRRRGRSLAG
jgi:hypothetical protein